MKRGGPLRQVSAKREAENRERERGWKRGERTTNVTCTECGRVVQKFISSVASGKSFCSTTCRDTHRAVEKVELVCPTCGKTFLEYASYLAVRTRKFCSKRCRQADPGSARPLTCKQCGERRVADAWVLADPRRGKFCSRSCYDAWRKDDRSRQAEVTCATCGKRAWRPVAWVRQSTKATYCDAKCKAVAQERGPSLPRRGVTWRRLAEVIRDRDSRCCVRCGTPEQRTEGQGRGRLHVDHIIPARWFKDPAVADAPENLASLCTPCHGVKTHRVEPRMVKGDWLALADFYGASVAEAAKSRLGEGVSPNG